MTMDGKRLDEIAARASRATEGDWVPDGRVVRRNGLFIVARADNGPDDAAFIADARADVPDLVAEVRWFVKVLRMIASVDTDQQHTNARVEWCKKIAASEIARYEVK